MLVTLATACRLAFHDAKESETPRPFIAAVVAPDGLEDHPHSYMLST